MTVNSNLNKIQYVGAGGVTLFPFPYPFELTTDIVTTVVDTSVTPPADISGSFTFVVAGGAGDVGSVTITPAPDTVKTTNRITIKRVVAATQLTSYPESGQFPAKAHEKALDKLTELAQQIFEGLGRTLALSVNTALSSAPVLQDPVPNAVLVGDATGANIIAGPLVIDVANAQSNAAIATAAAATATAAANAATASAGAINYRYCGTAAGSNGLTLTPGTALSSYTGALITFFAGAANTTETMTVNVSGLGAVPLKKNINGVITSFSVGQIQVGTPIIASYDGTNFVALTPSANSKAADIASASTVNTTASTITGDYANLTGTTSITAITLKIGKRFLFIHTGIHTLTNSATLVCLTGANVTTAVGDISEWISDGTNTYMVRYERADGTSLGKITNANLATMAANTIKANNTGSTAAPADITLSALLDMIGSATQGDILFRGASSWARLGAGTSGNFLQTQGGGANPQWASSGNGSGSLGSTSTYWTFPGGLIVQAVSSTGATTTWPTTFPTAVVAIGMVLFPSVGNGDTTYLSVQTKSTSNCTWAAAGGTVVRLVIAIGF